MSQGRPLPLSGELENKIIDYRAWKRRALADGEISAEEARECVDLADALAADAGLLAQTARFAATCLAGERGFDSGNAIRRWNERRKLVPFPSPDDTRDPEAA